MYFKTWLWPIALSQRENRYFLSYDKPQVIAGSHWSSIIEHVKSQDTIDKGLVVPWYVVTNDETAPNGGRGFVAQIRQAYFQFISDRKCVKDIECAPR